MNIVFFLHCSILPQKGGIQRVTSVIGEELAARDHNIYYLVTKKIQVDDRSVWHERQYYIDCSKKSEESIISYRSFLKLNNIDVVISQIPNDEHLFLLTNTPLNIKRLSVYHTQPFPLLGMERDFKKNTISYSIKHIVSRFITILWPFLYRKRILAQGKKEIHKMADVSDKIVLLSNKFFPRILAYTNVPLEKLAAINNPVSFEANVIDKNMEKENLIIYVGRLENIYKNTIRFVEMWKIFSESHPGWRAEIIGEGNSRDEIERYINEYHVDRISLEGLHKDVENYYQRAKFVCLTSRSEGWGMVLTEGMSYGCVPVCFDSYESCHDIIFDRKDGIIVPPFDTVEMALRIAEIGDNENKYKKISKSAIKKVKQFSVKTIVDQWENLLYELNNNSSVKFEVVQHRLSR